MNDFKLGDRVRYTLTGEATIRQSYNDPYGLFISTKAVVMLGNENLTLELIEPEIALPTTPGTIVIIDPTGGHACTAAYVLTGVGWRGDGFTMEQDGLLDDCRAYGYRIVEVEQ